MKPPYHIERALTTVGLKPTCRPKILTASRSALEISVIIIVDHLPLLDTATSNMRTLAQFTSICETHLLTAATAHAWGLLILPCPIYLPLPPFFCVVKRRLTKLAVIQV